MNFKVEFAATEKSLDSNKIINLRVRLVFHIVPAKVLTFSFRNGVRMFNPRQGIDTHFTSFVPEDPIKTRMTKFSARSSFGRILQLHSSKFSFSFLSLHQRQQFLLSPILCKDIPLSTILRLSIVPPGTSCTLIQRLVGERDPSHCGLGSSIFINDNNFLSLMVGEL